MAKIIGREQNRNKRIEKSLKNIERNIRKRKIRIIRKARIRKSIKS